MKKRKIKIKVIKKKLSDNGSRNDYHYIIIAGKNAVDGDTLK